MRKILMAASAALLASTMGVFAQEPGNASGAATPEIKKMEEGTGAGGSVSGGAQADIDAGGTASTKQPDAAGAASGEVQVETGASSEATAPKVPGTDGKATGEAQADTDASGEATTQKQPDAAGAASGEAQADTDAGGDATKQGQAGATGETQTDTQAEGGAAAKQDDAAAGTSSETTASINLTAEQQTEVRTVFREVKVEPVDVDIEINVGVVAPETVVLHPLPARIIEIVPAYRSYKYFVLADGTIVIVVPDTRKVVYVIAA